MSKVQEEIQESFYRELATVDGAAHTMVITSDGQPMKTLQVSLGAAKTPTYLGTAVVMPFGVSTDFDDLLMRIAAFFRDESCGQCVPCRVGTVRQEEALHRLTAGAPPNGSTSELGLLAEIDEEMRMGSICGLGHTAGNAIRSAINLGLIGERHD